MTQVQALGMHDTHECRMYLCCSRPPSMQACNGDAASCTCRLCQKVGGWVTGAASGRCCVCDIAELQVVRLLAIVLASLPCRPMVSWRPTSIQPLPSLRATKPAALKEACRLADRSCATCEALSLSCKRAMRRCTCASQQGGDASDHQRMPRKQRLLSYSVVHRHQA